MSKILKLVPGIPGTVLLLEKNTGDRMDRQTDAKQ